MKTRLLALAVVALLAASLALPAVAVAETWTGASNPDWSVDGNWTSPASAPTNGATVLFTGSSTTNLATNNDIIGLSLAGISSSTPTGNVSIDGNALTLGSGGITLVASGSNDLAVNTDLTLSASQNWTLAGAAGRQITIGTSSANTVDLNGNTLTLKWGSALTSMTINSSITGNGAVSFLRVASNSATTFKLLGENTYSGGTTIDQGGEIVQIGSDKAFGTGPVVITGTGGNLQSLESIMGPHVVKNNLTIGAAIKITGSEDLTFDNPVTVSATSTLSYNSTAANPVTFNNTVDLGSSQLIVTVIVGGSSTGVIAFKNAISGTGSINASANGTANTNFTNLAFEAQNTYSGGTTLAGTGMLVQLGSSSVGSGAGVTKGPLGTGLVTTNNGTVPRFQAINGAQTLGNDISMSSGFTVQGANDLTFTGSLTEVGAGRTLFFSNPATTKFTGNINLSELTSTGRTLSVAGPAAAVDSNVVFDGVIQNHSSGSGAGTTAGNVTYASTFKGTATINGANTYNGTTTLTGGGTYTVALGNKTAFGTSAVAANGANIKATTNLTGANKVANAFTFGGNNTFIGSDNLELGGLVTDTGTRTLTNNMSGGLLTLSGGVNLSSNASNFILTVAGTGNTLINSTISNGTGGSTASSLTKSGSGILTLSGANTYKGATNVLEGTLVVGDNSLATGAVTVGGGANAAKLGGNAKIGGATTLTTNGTIGPGNSIGRMDYLNNLTLSGGTWEWEFSGGQPPAYNAPIGADIANVAGILTITTAATLSAAPAMNLGTYVYTGDKFIVFNYATANTAPNSFQFNGLVDDTIVTIGGKQWVINYNDTNFALAKNFSESGGFANAVTVTAIPEASSLLTVVLGGIFAIGAVWLGRRYGFATFSV